MLIPNKSKTICCFEEYTNLTNIHHFQEFHKAPILGPLLFLLFINDLPEFIPDHETLLFVDDLKIYNKINSMEDTRKLQRSLDNIDNWCAINQLSVNTEKCKELSFSRNK
jgi:hypothetical protein